MDKKKIFAIVLFLVMSLFLFSFANPEELEFVEFEEETPVVEPVEEEPTVEEPIVEEPTVEEPQVLTPVQNNSGNTNTRRSSSNTNTSNRNNNSTNTNTNTNTNNSNTENNNNTSSSNENNNTPTEAPVKPNAPVLSVTPERVVILLGDDFDIKSGLSIESSENLTVATSVDDIKDLNVGEHTVTYTVTDSYDQSANASRTIVVLDPNSDEDNDGYTNKDERDNGYSLDDGSSHPKEPTLTLKGDNPLTVLQGHVYNEPGYLFTVDESDDVTREAIISGVVNTAELGRYELTYKLVDKYGKEVEKTRLVSVKEDINNNNIDDDLDERFTVKFYDFDKKQIKEEIVLIGMDASAPQLEDVENYIFMGWDKEFNNVKENLDIYALYEKDINKNGIPDTQDEIYSVKFYNIEQELVKEENVLIGLDATAPELAPVSKKIFMGWDKEYTSIQSDLDVYPVYKDDVNENGINDEEDTRYIVKFYDKNNTAVKEEIVLVGTSATAPVLDPVDNYIFVKWDKSFDNVTSDLDVYPIYGDDINNNGVIDEEDTRYTVKFYSKSNKVIKEENVLIGLDATAPELSEEDGYIFSHWDKDYTNVQSHLDVYPVYLEDKNHNGKNDEDEEHYTVTFKTNEYGYLNRIGAERESTVVYENVLTGLTFEEAGIIVPSVIENSGYYYIKWDKEFAQVVTEDLTYNAVYTYQDGIRVTKKDANTNLTFQINSDEDQIKDNILVYRTYKDNLKDEELLNEYTTDFSTRKKGTFKLTVTDGEFSDNNLSYEIIKETAYSTKFTIEYNTSKSYDRCSSRWDNNCSILVHQPVNYNFFEITESYIGIVIDLKSLVVEYTDNSTDTFSSYDFGLIRWESTTIDGHKRIPVYKTPALDDEGKIVKYVTVNFTKQYKRYYIKFEYRDGKFVAIEGNEND